MASPSRPRSCSSDPRFRRIRQQLGLSQTQIAEGLGISPSYINLIERNQRPVTAQLLLRLAETYDLDLRDLATADEDRFFAELNEMFSDPLFRQIDLPKQELRDLAELCPGVTHALQRLYAAYTEARRGETLVAAQFADRDEDGARATKPTRSSGCATCSKPTATIFPSSSRPPKSLRDEMSDLAPPDLFAALCQRGCAKSIPASSASCRSTSCAKRYGAGTAIAGSLLISELIEPSGRVFQFALQIGLAECGPVIDAIITRSGALDETARRLYRVTLANYFAAAVMMPYQAFHSARGGARL